MYPSYNRSFGFDHVITLVFDNGAFCGAGNMKPNYFHGEIAMKFVRDITIIGNNGFSGRYRWDLHRDKPFVKCTPSYNFCHREGFDIAISQPLSS